ncbi:MAG: FtsX-like permease family protein [Opitutales bacterium]|nr:FtsX-like permease family protein [Opitutales bacterium]
MSFWKIIANNLLYFRRQNLGVALGVALCAMVLIGALTVGDSVRSTLSKIAEARIGKADMVLLATDGFFREELANEIATELEDGTVVAPVVVSRGTISLPDGSGRVGNVQVLGVEESFWQLAPDTAHSPIGSWANKKNWPEWGAGNFFANERLHKLLKVADQGRIILRIEEPSLFSRDAPLSGERDNKFVSFNGKLSGPVSADGFGHFGIQGNQREPLTLFVPLKTLQKRMFRSFDEENGKTDFANFLLLGRPGSGIIDEKSTRLALEKSWTLSDAGISVKLLRDTSAFSVRARQVFLNSSLEKAAQSIDSNATGVLTYLVNAIETENAEGNGSGLIPYSMVSAVDPKRVLFMPDDWREDEIILNQWAIDDLGIKIGDSITLRYFSVSKRRKLVEDSKKFILRGICPNPPKMVEGEESDWTPQFPGLSDAESCGEWDTGIPITNKIRPKDEEYWNQHRGSPKAYISLNAGQELWTNRWGSLTGLRFSREIHSPRKFEKKLRNVMSANQAGLIFQSLRADAKAGSESPVDFGQLFLSFSFFVIIAALALTGMLFAFSIEQRNRQAGLLLALGIPRKKVRLLVLGEGLCVSILGVLLGVGLAVLYGQSMISLLSGDWSGAVSGASFEYSIRMQSIIGGGAAALLMSLLAMAWSTRRQLKFEPRELLSAGENLNKINPNRKQKKWSGSLISSFVFLFGAAGLGMSTDFSAPGASEGFFGAGAMLLLSGIFYFRHYLGQKAGLGKKELKDAKELSNRNMGRRTGRSLVTMSSMAAGTFLVVSTGAFRKSLPISPENPSSGTGGFSLIGESALSIYDDLNGAEGRELYDLNETLMQNTQVVPLRIREGDDASCLNLNKAVRPRIYGVKPDEMIDRFSFASGDWSMLKSALPDGKIPAVVDQNTMMWALKKGIGDEIEFLDGEGRIFSVQLVAAVKGSILQGALYISEEQFMKRFPQQGGYRSYLIVTPFSETRNMQSYLEDKFSNYGLELRESTTRLAELQKVENTYLAIFQGLGGLGMLLGTVGLAVVVVRNLAERSKEFGAMEALGYRLGHLRNLAFSEHFTLALWGLGVGSFSAVLAIVPAIFGKVGQFPGMGFSSFFILLVVLSFGWIKISVYCVLRKSQIEHLQEE